MLLLFNPLLWQIFGWAMAYLAHPGNLTLLIMFQIHRPHCRSLPPKFDHYDDVMPLLHHICNIFLRVIKSAI